MPHIVPPAPERIHPHRLILWGFLIIVAIFLLVWRASQLYLIESELEIIEQETRGLAPLSTGNRGESIDTSGWQTYRNEEYGFEFKYPADLSVQSENGVVIFFDCMGNACLGNLIAIEFNGDEEKKEVLTTAYRHRKIIQLKSGDELVFYYYDFGSLRPDSAEEIIETVTLF